MKSSATVIADSISERGSRLTTMQVVTHRFVLAEFNTHRRFSRNSASSRAIPVEKQLEKVWDDPADPLVWPREQPGMQGGDELSPEDEHDAQILWDNCRQLILSEIGEYLDRHPEKENRLHKSLLNRLIEPWMWHTIVVTSTEWENFFRQRCSPLAQPEIRATAEAMQEALESSTPTPIEHGGWHLPYVSDHEKVVCEELELSIQKVSAARCARVSYLTQEGMRDVREDIKLCDRLMSASPPHMSPFEHVATPRVGSLAKEDSNFEGWVQLRTMYFGRV